MSNIPIYTVAIVLFAYFVFLLKKELQMMQQNSYFNVRYLKWAKGNFWSRYDVIRSISKKNEKIKLHFTPRAIRLFIAEILIAAAVIIASFLLTKNPLCIVVSEIVLIICSFAVIMLANLCVAPIEKALCRWYINDARKKLQQHDSLIKIAITGSYGKTSVKHFLYDILSEKYSVLMTPGSFNTPLGVTRTIREQLQPIHEVFIAEMGAKQTGDIQEICDIVKPKYGILTSVGLQHLETFGSFENVKKTKLEIIAALPSEGVGYVNFDNLSNADIPGETKAEIHSFAVHSAADFTAKNIVYGNRGMSFDVFHREEKILTLETKLLGEHNISNLLACCAIALHLGVEKYKIEKAARHIQPVRHRLEVKKLPNGITVIDDAFNSNPVGSQMALEALKRFEGNKKIVITPGMIELGEKEYELNYEFGKNIAAHCDIAVLVGTKQTKPIQDGIKATNFPPENLFVCKSLNEANEQAKKIMQAGDVVLYENDLPDTFNE